MADRLKVSHEQNICAINEEDKLHVFDRNGMYLAAKKIGKNNSKAAEIEADNMERVKWNRTVDRALISGVAEKDILGSLQSFLRCARRSGSMRRLARYGRKSVLGRRLKRRRLTSIMETWFRLAGTGVDKVRQMLLVNLIASV